MSKIGPMKLYKVKKVTEKSINHSVTVFEIRMESLYNCKKALFAATKLHAFATIRDGKEVFLPTDKLQSGDEIWVDCHAFSSDGSLRQ